MGKLENIVSQITLREFELAMLDGTSKVVKLAGKNEKAILRVGDTPDAKVLRKLTGFTLDAVLNNAIEIANDVVNNKVVEYEDDFYIDKCIVENIEVPEESGYILTIRAVHNVTEKEVERFTFLLYEI